MIVFEVVKAARAAITIDEAATYLGYISSSVLALFNFGSANNHFLNTLMAKFFNVLGGNHELVLRVPNLLGYAIYLLFSFLLLDRFIKDKFIVVCGFLLLNVNPYVLDFFVLCRGYGLSIGFLMPALFFFVSFLDRMIGIRPGATRHLHFSLIAAALAVLSYFGLLNVYLSLIAFAFVFLVVINIQSRRRRPQAESVPETPRRKKAVWLPLTLAAVVFNLSVICQDLSLVQNLFEPVTVRMAGLNETDGQAIRIFRVDAKNLETELPYQDGLWKLAEPVYFSAIKFRCLPGLLDRTEKIEIAIGGKIFAYDAADIKKFKRLPHKKFIIFSSPSSTSLERSVFPMFKSVINWKGDGIYLKVFLRRILLIAGIMALAIVLTTGVGRLLSRWKLFTLEQFHPLAATTLTLGIFLGYPFYILRRTGELYYGGQTGFIRDTVYSLIYRSFYGRAYFGGQERTILAFIYLVLLGALIVVFVRLRKKSLAEGLSGIFLLAILVLASVSTLAQRALSNTAYLFGRKGLFFIPLFMLFLVFLFSDLTRLTKGLKTASSILIGFVTALSIGHFCLTANTVKIFEWKADADTKSLLAEMRDIKEGDAAHPGKIRLAVEAGFNPSIQYYLQRNRWTWLEVNTVPPYEGHDYYYLDEYLDISEITSPPLVILKRYPWSGNILAKPKAK